MKMLPWDQRIARIIVRPLANTRVTPNHITALTLCMALASSVLFAFNDLEFSYLAAGIFVASRFLDHFDGELARLQGSTSQFGYYFDYLVGGIGYAALFIGLGIGYWQDDLGGWAILLGAAGGASALISLYTNLGIDRETGDREEGEATGYPAFAGIELEDGIYLLAPITWFGFLKPFFVAACIGASIYCIWTIITLMLLRSGRRRV